MPTTPLIHLNGRTVLVTGATAGIGSAIARSCAQAGANIVIHGLAEDADARATLDACRAHGVRASLVTADLIHGATESIVDRFFAAATAAEPDIDTLVCNAGGAIHYGPFVNMTHEQFEELYRFNVAVPYFLTQRFARRWIEKGVEGRVLLIGSINGRLAEVESSLYDSAKGAVEMMVKSLGAELAAKRIRVNGLAPGLIRTPKTNWVDTQTHMADWMRHHTPNGQIPPADVCGPAAAFLLSDAAEHIVGHMLVVDGGIGCWQQPPPPGGLTW